VENGQANIVREMKIVDNQDNRLFISYGIQHFEDGFCEPDASGLTLTFGNDWEVGEATAEAWDCS
jgi:hypothetical protein